MSPISTPHTAVDILFLPYVNMSDAGVYICEVTLSDSTNNPYFIPQSGSVNITLTVISKFGTLPASCKYIQLHKTVIHIEVPFINEFKMSLCV